METRGLVMDTNAKTGTPAPTTAMDAAASAQVARAAYAVWINQRDRNVAEALAHVAEHAADPAVRHWAAGVHPRVVLETMEADFRELAEQEHRALGR